MKKILSVALLLCIFMSTYAQIEMNSNGKVGICKTPNSSYSISISGTTEFDNGPYTSFLIGSGSNYNKALYPATNGSGTIGKPGYYIHAVYYKYMYKYSDARIKENIRKIEKPLQTILNLEGVKYDIIEELSYNDLIIDDSSAIAQLDNERKNKLGFIAQEVEPYLPEAVNYNPETDEYSIDYQTIIPVLVEAMKIQQRKIKKLQRRIEDLEAANNDDGDSRKSGQTGSGFNNNLLEQNTPNPFTQQTTINYTIADNVTNAMLCIYDLNGTQLKCYEIVGTGTGSQVVAASELNPGMYLYSLIVEGQLIDTKRMVLTN